MFAICAFAYVDMWIYVCMLLKANKCRTLRTLSMYRMCHIKQLPLFIMCEYYNDRSETVIQRVRPRNCALMVFFRFYTRK